MGNQNAIFKAVVGVLKQRSVLNDSDPLY